MTTKEYDKEIRTGRDKRYHSFYTSKEWRNLAPIIKRRYKDLCLWSYYHDHQIVDAEEVHHIEPLRVAWERRLDPSNLIPLSHAAHMMIEAEYKKGNHAIKRQLFDILASWLEEFSPRGSKKV